MTTTTLVVVGEDTAAGWVVELVLVGVVVEEDGVLAVVEGVDLGLGEALVGAGLAVVVVFFFLGMKGATWCR